MVSTKSQLLWLEKQQKTIQKLLKPGLLSSRPKIKAGLKWQTVHEEYHVEVICAHHNTNGVCLGQTFSEINWKHPLNVKRSISKIQLTSNYLDSQR